MAMTTLQWVFFSILNVRILVEICYSNVIIYYILVFELVDESHCRGFRGQV